MRRFFPGGAALLVMFFIANSRSGSAASVTPLANLTLMGGQNFLDGTASSVGGNADAVVTPVVKFSDRWSLFPTYHGFYQGTQDIQTLAGGGLLFRDSTGHSLLVKSVHTLGAWKVKPSLGIGMEWLRETRDEEWGQGLFDYRKFNGGLEAEYNSSSGAGGRLAYDYYQMDFPNYTSLESAQDPTLSRELAGKDVINNANHMATGGLWCSLPAQGRLDVTAVLTQRLYKDQPVVNEEGQLTATDRQDTIDFLDSVLVYPWRPFDFRLLAQLGLRYGIQNSNQNHYDSKLTAYQSNYYDYTEWQISPELTSALNGGRSVVTLGGVYEERDYDQRTTQDINGTYLSEKLKVTTLITRLSLAHSISAHTKVRFDGSLGWSHSNTDYEAVFRYNYRMASYGLGFSYEY